MVGLLSLRCGFYRSWVGFGLRWLYMGDEIDKTAHGTRTKSLYYLTLG